MKTIKIAAFIAAFIPAASGCQMPERLYSAAPESAVAEMEAGEDEAEARAAGIAEAARGVEGVADAAAVVTGKTAIVAIRAEGEPADEELLKMKKLVYQRVRKADKKVRRVAVSVAPEMFERLTGGAADPPEAADEDALFQITPNL
jgi:YhcN/YlaJ family sporulation lipoprotein